MKFIGIIPARYASTRFPGKPLADLCGKPVVQHVYERVSTVLDTVLVATDDYRIYDAVCAFGGKAVMTSAAHRSGTDRCWEAYCNYGEQADVIVNVQGDEPFVHPSQIETLKRCFPADIATLAKPYRVDDDLSSLSNPNNVKVVFSGTTGCALYFSRSVIPYLRGVDPQEWLRAQTYYKHIGIYAYRVDVLERITCLEQSLLERAESLEQLRWLENGFQIKVALSDVQSVGIDTPEDLQHAVELLQKGGV